MIIKIIEGYLEKSRNQDKERTKKCFSVSQLHHPCLRYLYYSYFGIPQEFTPKTLRVFDNGHHVHERLQDYLEKASVLVEREVSVCDDEYQIYGRCDGIVQLNEKRGVLEIKSINAKGFANILPKQSHVTQLMIYIHLLGLKGGVILYENKDSQELNEFYLPLDKGVVERTLRKVQCVLSYIEKEQFPPKTNFFCDTCGFLQTCQSGDGQLTGGSHE